MAQRSPGAWLELLSRRLDARWGVLRKFDAYYEGDQTLAFMTRKFRDAYGGLFRGLSDNWMPIVVDSSVERLRVQGFRFGKSQKADDDAWDIWQGNNLDGGANMVHTEAVKLGWAYWLVQPTDDELPQITGEHPSQVIVAHAPGDRTERLAALKKWLDGEDGYMYANVYLPDRVVKFRSQKPRQEWSGLDVDWGTGSIVPNPLGKVPIVPVLNNPSMLHGGKSDLAGGPLRIQDGINKLLADMLIGSEFQAYPQRVLLGVDVPRDENDMPIKNADVKAGQNRLWYVPSKEAKAFEFSSADLNNFRDAIDGLVKDLTAQTRTPPHYVAGQIVNASGDALKAAETGLVSKVRDKQDPFGEAHEEALRLAFKAMGDDRRAEEMNAETIWADPESRSQAELADALTKLATIGVPREILWERYGFSPQEIDRMKQMAEEEALLVQALAPEPEGAEPATNGKVPPASATAPAGQQRRDGIGAPS